MKTFHKHFILLCTILLNISIQLSAQFKERIDLGTEHTYLSTSELGGGVSLIDYNNDGWLDIYMPGGELPDRFLKNLGNWEFEDISHIIPFHNIDVAAAGVADINNDGCDDMLLCAMSKSMQSILLINNCDESFTATTNFGLIDKEIPIMNVSFIDFNSDGLLDMYISRYVETPNIVRDTLPDGNVIKRFPHICYTNELYRNTGNFEFQRVEEQYMNEDLGCSFASIQTPMKNGIGWYSINDFGEDVIPNQFHVYDPILGIFSEESEISGVDLRHFGMGADIADIDQDLDIDIYVTDIGDNELLINEGDRYINKAQEFGIDNTLTNSNHNSVGWTPLFFDVDNDSDVDLFIANGYINITERLNTSKNNPNSFYENVNGIFIDKSDEYKVSFTEVNRGAVKGDLDNDGDLDLIIGNKFLRRDDTTHHFYRILENTQTNNNNYITVKLQGITNNRNGFGTTVYIHHGGNAYMDFHASGGNHASFDDNLVHFGLGKSAKIDSLVVVWQNGVKDVIHNPAINQTIKIIEGEYTTTTSNENIGHEFEVSIFPNPTDNLIHIQTSNADLPIQKVSIYDSLGRLLITSNQKVIALERFSDGLFFVEILTSKGKVMHKMLKTR